MEDVWRRERSQGRRGAANHNAALLRTRVAAGVAQAGLAVAHVELPESEQRDQVEKKRLNSTAKKKIKLLHLLVFKDYSFREKKPKTLVCNY